MIALDTNLLVYAHRSAGPFHAEARRCVEELVAGPGQWGLPWPVCHEFLSVVTGRRSSPPTPLATALGALERLLDAPGCVTLDEGPGHFSRLREVATSGSVRGPMVYDAAIAAICIGHGVRELWTADRDYGRFPALKTRNPLVG